MVKITPPIIPYSSITMAYTKSEYGWGRIFRWSLLPGPLPVTPPEATAIIACLAWKGSSLPSMKLITLLLTVPQRSPNCAAAEPANKPMSTSIARYFTGTRPINMTSIQVAKSNTAVDKLVKAINPQMIPHQISIGISDSLISSMFCCFLESMLARLMINARLAKSEGWNELPIIGMVIHRAASLMEVPFVNV